VHSLFHEKLAELMATVGKNLELHVASIDPRDVASRPEYEAYTSLVEQHRDLGELLRSTAEEMASYSDLPLANHDPTVLSSPAVMDAFRELILRQEELAAMLEAWVERDRTMLDAAEGAGDG
jgi:hypothetical protein